MSVRWCRPRKAPDPALSAPVPVTFLVDQLASGGAERHAIQLANALDRSRFRVSLVALKPDATLKSLVNEQALESFWCAGVASKLDLAAVSRISAHLDRTGARVVVAANQYPTLYATLARRRTASPARIIGTYHTTLLQSWKERLQMLLYSGFVFPNCDVLVYVSENQRRYWRGRGLRARSDTVIHNGVDAAHFSAGLAAARAAVIRRELGPSAAELVVGICAALRPEKAHADLLAACAQAVAAGANLHCLIIGDGPERAAIVAAADSLGIGGRVTITGFQADVRPYIDACDVMVLASYTETFSLAALESMAMGKPVIMTQVGGADEQVTDGDDGRLFAARATDELARHILAMRDTALRQSMGTRAREKVVCRFALSDMVETYSRLLETQAALGVG